jgi:starch phosphorylase
MRFNTRSQFASGEEPGEGDMVAYFSMEIAVLPEFPTYSGGLGVLAGDTLRAAADLGVPLAAVTLAHRKGYFQQHLDAGGIQTEEPQPWHPEGVLAGEDPIVTVTIEGRPVGVRAWRYDLEGVTASHSYLFPGHGSGAERPAGSDADRYALWR